MNKKKVKTVKFELCERCDEGKPVGQEHDCPTYQCVICHTSWYGYGNNAQPVAKGSCCSQCNRTEVIPRRLKNLDKYFNFKVHKDCQD